MTVTCPNCGSEIPIPNRKKKSIKCPYCDMGGLERSPCWTSAQSIVDMMAACILSR